MSFPLNDSSRQFRISRLERIRRTELQIFSDFFGDVNGNSRERFTVVEIGGGSGYLAKEMSEMGLSVKSFDPNPRQPLEFPVQKAFGHELPIEDETADFVLAAHVMEHIPVSSLGPTFHEIRRILRPSGLVIIILPTSAAMLFTVLLQPPGNFIRLSIHLKRLVGRGRSLEKQSCNNPLLSREETLTVKLIKGLTLRWLVPAPHGVGKSALHELWTWRRTNWCRIFSQNGFEVVEVRSSGLAFSLHQILGEHLWPLRKILGRLGLSGSAVFLLRPELKRHEKRNIASTNE